MSKIRTQTAKMNRFFQYLKNKLSLPENVDLFFLFLRLFTVVGGVIWYVIAPLDPETRNTFTWILFFYTAYSTAVYLAIYRWRQAIRAIYLTTLGVDLIFVSILVRYLDHLAGSFFIAFYLLVAIHSYYFGLRIGLMTAFFSALLYGFNYFDLAGYVSLPWPEFVLRVTFLFLIGLALGLLAEQEKGVRQKIQDLNRELARKNSVLEQTYRHLSIGKLIGDIAEGINGPCGVMAVRSELLMDDAKEKALPQAFLQSLEVINKCSHQIALVIRSLLSLSKHTNFEMTVLNLNQLVEEDLVLMDRQFKAKGIKLDRHLTPNLPSVKGDPYELKGVLINIITNAMDALPEGGTIRITTQRDLLDGGFVECTVADNGTGIDEEHLENIFNPFFTTKQQTGGVGLGLSTSLSVMKKHNGLLKVKSKRGQGSEFSLSLPPNPS